MGKSKNEQEKLRTQRDYQKEYRDRMRAERRPGRDDVARVCLHLMIMNADKKGGQDVGRLIEVIAEPLTEQGFDQNASLDVIENLIEKYTKGKWDFRRKMHLRRRPGDGGTDGTKKS
ncbi:hypothetical protein GCM10011385_40410 [Nitratireductor aestuarii]|uniref:Uncharacterized protein n=1 Tax=Nitratireductor aestuarii TaxID=1735103 RepID=A0A916WB69_9HYPH|nr:hypothetical protein [Nitratireductor aestuarii]GGA82108.1 hypothetical protein GCM10011385_40410 [Nitratireductor aestuarii]